MKVGTIYFASTYTVGYMLFGLRFLKAGQVLWELPLTSWNLATFPIGEWVNFGTAQGVDADKVVVRLGHAETFHLLKIMDYHDPSQFFQVTLPLQPLDTVQEFPYDLPATAPSPSPPPSAPVSVTALDISPSTVAQGGKTKITATVQVSSTFRGYMRTYFMVNDYPTGLADTGLRDFLAGSYQVPLELEVPSDTPPGVYPVRWSVLDHPNQSVLALYTTQPILTVTQAPPPQPAPSGVAINSVAISPTKARPGDTVTVTAQVTVTVPVTSGLAIAVFQPPPDFQDAYASAGPRRDFLVGSYEVSLPLTILGGTPPGMGRVEVRLLDGQNTALASQWASLEILEAEVPPTQPTPTPTSPLAQALAGVMAAAALGLMGSVGLALLETLKKE